MSNENDPPWNNPTWRPQMVMYGVSVTGEPVPTVPDVTTPLPPSPFDLLKPMLNTPNTLEGLQLQQLLANVTVLTEAVAKLTEEVRGISTKLTVISAQNAKPRKSAAPPAARKRR